MWQVYEDPPGYSLTEEQRAQQTFENTHGLKCDTTYYLQDKVKYGEHLQIHQRLKQVADMYEFILFQEDHLYGDNFHPWDRQVKEEYKVPKELCDKLIHDMEQLEGKMRRAHGNQWNAFPNFSSFKRHYFQLNEGLQ